MNDGVNNTQQDTDTMQREYQKLAQEGSNPKGPNMPSGFPDISSEPPAPTSLGAKNAGRPAGPSGAPAQIVAPDGGQGVPPAEDPVSGALNVPGFGMGFGKALASRDYESLALWYIDIRNFRSVNPNFGFFAGNTVLRTLVEGMKLYLTGTLPVARLGADRFILLSRKLDFDEAENAFNEMIAWIRSKNFENGIQYQIDLVGGIYFLREPDLTAHDFKKALDYASIAHRNARRNPGSCLLMFTEEDLRLDNRRILIEQSFETALKSGQIEVWYQPQIDYTFGEIIGAEALARWNHPEIGWISPAEFVPVLEKCGKVHALDLFVWEEACRSAGRWRNASDGCPVPICVNVSRAEMFEEGLMEHFLDLQDKYNLPEGSLHLEITESAFVEEADRLYDIIDAMRSKHLLVEMDDFGSGLSSLHMLKDVPVDVVKLDMGFMRTAVNEERGGVVLSSVIRMLQGLDTPIIAEGVETHEQAEMLKNMGCHLMQGFHFSRPMPLDEFEEYISSTSTAEITAHRKRQESHLEDLMSFDPTSSFIFNNAIGGMILFLIDGETTESLLVNDAFYKECGLPRDQFSNTKVNPIQEIDSESRATLWRAASEARENGSALCTAKVRISKRWIECIMRFISTSARGDVFSLNIRRSGIIDEEENTAAQIADDAEWSLNLLRSIIPNGFLKCAVDDKLTIHYLSEDFLALSGLSRVEFMRRYHNSFANAIAIEDRVSVNDAILEASESGSLIDIDFALKYGFNGEVNAQIIGRVTNDKDDEKCLYAIILVKGKAIEGAASNSGSADRVIPFDYYIEGDKLVVRDSNNGDDGEELVFENWLENLELLPERITAESASKIIATVQDLKRHPISGFTDIKCNLRGGNLMRWYHVNYTCEADDSNATTVIHGYAQDANDQMGSAKWWRRQAEVDYLTGLLNRNAVEQEINLAMRTEGSGIMLMIDLDGFKRVNDDLGHLTGDALLRDVARALEGHFRNSDILGRYGGDEFVAFVPIAISEAHAIAEKRAMDILDDIARVEIPDGTHTACSIGVAISGNRDTTFYDLLEAADRAMYISKEGGKGTYTIIDME